MFDDVVAGLRQLTDSELDERVREIEIERRRLDAELAAAIAVAEQRQLPAIDGHRSIASYLRATINCSNGEAGRLRSLGRAVDQVAGLGEAWITGRFGASQAARFAVLYGNQRIRGQLVEFAPTLLDHAERLPYADFSLCIDRFVALADADGSHEARDDAVEHRDAHVRALGAMVDITANGGDGATAEEMIAIHRRFVEQEFRNDVEARRAEFGDRADLHPLPRTAGQRRFDALLQIFRRAATANGEAAMIHPLVNIVIDAATWAHLLADSGLAPSQSLDGDPIDPFTGSSQPIDLLHELVGSASHLATRRCETAGGVPLHPHDVLRAALAGHVRRVVVDASGVVVDLGRRQRLFVGAAREAAKLLVQRCEHPGCELPADCCSVDHAEEWAAGGATDQANGRIRCDNHNVDKTRHRWRSGRATDGRTYTIRADGTIMLPAGVRPPTFPDEASDDDAEHTTNLARQRVAGLGRTA